MNSLNKKKQWGIFRQKTSYPNYLNTFVGFSSSTVLFFLRQEADKSAKVLTSGGEICCAKKYNRRLYEPTQ